MPVNSQYNKGVGRSLGASLLLSAAGAGAAQLWTPARTAAYAALAVGVLAAAILVIAPGGMTWADRRRRRRRFRNPVRAAAWLFSTSISKSKVGVVWDGDAAHVYVALLPAPFQVTVPDSTDPILPTMVPMDIIRDLLVQSDIRLADATVLQTAYRRFARSPYNDVLAGDVGDTDYPVRINTVIDMSVSMTKSMRSVQARAYDDQIPPAMTRTAHVTAARLESKLNIDGYTARLLTRDEVARLHMAGLWYLNDGLLHEGSTHLGEGSEMQSVMTRPVEWTPAAARSWYQVPAERMFAAYTLRPGELRSPADSVSAVIGYSYAGAADLPESRLGLTRAEYEQGDLATRLLPLAVTVPTDSHADILVPTDREFPVPVPATGLDVMLGRSLDGGTVFMNLSTGGEILYVHGPREFVACLAARASATGTSVAVRIPDEDGMWDTLASATNPALIAVDPSWDGTVEVVRYDGAHLTRPARNTAVIAWCPKGVPEWAAHCIEMGRDRTGRISTPQVLDLAFQWEPSGAEQRFLPLPALAAAVG